MPNPKLNRAVTLFKAVKVKEKEIELLMGDLRKAITDLTNVDFVEYMQLTKDGKITIENEVEECKRES